MVRNISKALAAVMVVVVFLIAGCGGGGSGLQRITGLTPDGVVKTFFEAAKGGRMNEAGLYVSPVSANDPSTALKFMTGQSGLAEIQKANLLTVKKIAEQGNFAVVVSTVQQEQNSLKISVKPTGLEKINGEWYIVDVNQIANDAKYQVLQQLLTHI